MKSFREFRDNVAHVAEAKLYVLFNATTRL